MAYETFTRSLRDATLTLSDTDDSDTVTINTDEGDLTWTENIEVKEIVQRGSLSHALAGNEQPQDVSFTLRFTEFLGATGSESPYKWLKGDIGGTVGSSASDAAEVFQTKLIFVVNTPVSSPGVGTTELETITFGKFFATSYTFTEGDEYSTLAVAGRNFESEPSIARTAAT